ncbi:SLAM family member 9-like [Xenopus laevis]|uniref:SLAM family member 9-like n=1 Tax=Xenopus laevis TaxID=8355 RepID=A0A8J1LLG3_XENLA|nr:SLAM family member 9-like [Xenopus laevis]
MKLLLYQTLILLSWYKYISCNKECGPRINVSGAEGGGASLPVKLQEQIKEITWIISNGDQPNLFATTKPNEPVDIWDNKYEGKLYSETDASLTLTDLTNQDQGIYSAAVRLRSNKRCVQLYHLQVYKNLSSADILIHQNITHNETCNITVTLTCIVNASDVTVTWNSTDSPDTEVTNHTLRVYNAPSKITYSCAAKNPVSEASRTAHIPASCPEGPTSAMVAGPSILKWWIALIVVAVVIVVSAVHYRSKRKKRDQQNPAAIKGQTVNAEVQKHKRETGSGSGTEDERDESVVTLYSEVQLPKGPGNQAERREGNPYTKEKTEELESCYALIQGPGNQAERREDNPYTKEKTEELESCYALIQAHNDPSSNSPMKPYYNEVV